MLIKKRTKQSEHLTLPRSNHGLATNFKQTIRAGEYMTWTEIQGIHFPHEKRDGLETLVFSPFSRLTRLLAREICTDSVITTSPCFMPFLTLSANLYCFLISALSFSVLHTLGGCEHGFYRQSTNLTVKNRSRRLSVHC